MSKYRICINIKRPGWDNVKKAYDEINGVGKKEYYETLEATHNTIQAEIAQARKRYEKIGGKLLQAFNDNNAAYTNTCALRVSYALNYGGMPIKNYTTHNSIANKSYILQDKQYHKYFIRIEEMIYFLLSKEIWCNADEPYSPKNMTTKEENKNFYDNEFSRFDKNGIVAMRIDGWGDAKGHITLWDGVGKKFVDESNYLLYDRKAVVVKRLYFWGLK